MLGGSHVEALLEVREVSPHLLLAYDLSEADWYTKRKSKDI